MISPAGWLRKFGEPRIGHRFRQIEYRLLFVVESGRRESMPAVFDCQAKAVANKVKAAAARKRRRGQNARLDLFKKLFMQQFRNIDRRCLQEYSLAASLEPIDIILFGLLDNKIEVKPSLPDDGEQRSPPRGSLRKSVDRGLQTLIMRCQRIIRFAKLRVGGCPRGRPVTKTIRHQRKAAFSAGLVKTHPELLGEA